MAATAVLTAAVVAFLVRTDERVVARNIGLSVGPDGRALVQVPYRRDAPRGMLTVQVEGRTVVDGWPANPYRYGNNNYEFDWVGDVPDRARVHIRFVAGEAVDELATRVRVSRNRRAPTAPTQADEPVALAQGMYAMGKSRSLDDKLPADPLTAHAELADDLRIGIIDGANLWAQKKTLPISTNEVAGQESAVTAALRAALESGGSAQVRIHDRLATLLGMGLGPDGTYVEVRYPYGPIGTTVYRIDPGMLRWGITHTWK